MIVKIIILALVLFLIYMLFFKKSRKTNKPDDRLISDEMVECPTCNTFVSSKEAIVSSGKFFCSKDCLNKRG